MRAQRLRVVYRRGDSLRWVSNLDLMRFWERALRRAGLPLAYSQGFTPHPQISIAAALPVGFTSDGEVMDVYLSEIVPPARFIRDLSQQLPPGVDIRSVEEIGLGVPSVQSQVRWAEYEVDVRGDRPPADVDAAIERLLALETLPWEHRREAKVRRYDLRTQIDKLWRDPAAPEGRLRLRMRLRADQEATGRPEQVAAALGLPEPLRVHRTRLLLAESSPTREAWRRIGRFTE